MKSETRINLIATLLGAASGAGVCALWAALVWHGPLLSPTLCGLLTGALGGFLRSTMVEALVILAVAGFVLWFLQRLSGQLDGGGQTLARTLFALFAGGVVGKLAGAFFSLSNHDNDAA